MPQRAQPPHARPARGAVRDPAPAVWRRAFTNTGAGAPDPAAPRQSPGGPAGRPRPGSVCAARPQRTDSHTPARAARGEIGPAPPRPRLAPQSAAHLALLQPGPTRGPPHRPARTSSVPRTRPPAPEHPQPGPTRFRPRPRLGRDLTSDGSGGAGARPLGPGGTGPDRSGPADSPQRCARRKKAGTSARGGHEARRTESCCRARAWFPSAAQISGVQLHPALHCRY